MGKRNWKFSWHFIVFFSAVTTAAAARPGGLVSIRDVSRNIQVSMMYNTSMNFTGRSAPGYNSQCYLAQDVAEALGQVQLALEREGRGLMVKDCYRPQEATDYFVEWASDPDAGMGRQDMFFPLYNNKTDLFRLGYISRRSVHTQGRAVDLTVGELNNGNFSAFDMGTIVDFLDPSSRTAAQGQVGSAYINARHVENRQILGRAMRRGGFSNYPKEWWHWSR